MADQNVIQLNAASRNHAVKRRHEEQLAGMARRYFEIRGIADRGLRRESFVVWDAEMEELEARIGG